MVANNNLFHKLLNVIRKINDFDIFFESMNILLCVVQLHMSPFNSPKGDTFLYVKCIEEVHVLRSKRLKMGHLTRDALKT